MRVCWRWLRRPADYTFSLADPALPASLLATPPVPSVRACGRDCGEPHGRWRCCWRGLAEVNASSLFSWYGEPKHFCRETASCSLALYTHLLPGSMSEQACADSKMFDPGYCCRADEPGGTATGACGRGIRVARHAHAARTNDGGPLRMAHRCGTDDRSPQPGARHRRCANTERRKFLIAARSGGICMPNPMHTVMAACGVAEVYLSRGWAVKCIRDCALH